MLDEVQAMLNTSSKACPGSSEGYGSQQRSKQLELSRAPLPCEAIGSSCTLFLSLRAWRYMNGFSIPGLMKSVSRFVKCMNCLSVNVILAQGPCNLLSTATNLSENGMEWKGPFKCFAFVPIINPLQSVTSASWTDQLRGHRRC